MVLKSIQITENIDDTIPGYHLTVLIHRKKEVLLREIDFEIDDQKELLKKLFFKYVKSHFFQVFYEVLI